MRVLSVHLFLAHKITGMTTFVTEALQEKVGIVEVWLLQLRGRCEAFREW